MGEIRASVTLENRDDRGAVRLGLRVEADVRRTTVEGVVDTGAVSLVIPEEIATELELENWGTRTVVYADERREERPVTDVTIEIGNLATRTEAIVGPAGSEVLIGQRSASAVRDQVECLEPSAEPHLRPGLGEPRPPADRPDSFTDKMRWADNWPAWPTTAWPSSSRGGAADRSRRKPPHEIIVVDLHTPFLWGSVFGVARGSVYECRLTPVDRTMR